MYKRMSRVEQVQPSHLDVHHLHSSESQKALDVFLHLLTTCSGPSGKTHMVCNACGGHVTFTSTCSRLFSTMLISRPELKLIVTSVQSHLSDHHDCGLFMTCTCLHLVRSSLCSGIPVYVHSTLNEWYAQLICKYLESKDCKIYVTADFTDLKVLLAYVGSIFKSKSLLNLSCRDCSSLSELVVKAFVESIPTQQTESYSHSQGIHMVCVEKRQVRCSKLERGVLLEYPDLPVIRGPAQLKIRTSTVDCLSRESDTECCVKVALFTCSLSGDVEEIMDAAFEVTKQQSVDVERSIVARISDLCYELDRCEVGLVLCQKVIHPQVKSILRSKGIIFVDRLGSQVIPFLQDLTGAQPIASTMTNEMAVKFGWLKSVDHVVEGDKSYLLLARPSSCVVTLVMSAEWEEKLTELKVCVKTALRGLYSLSKEPRLLAGGGCWQSYCSYMLREKVLSQLPTLAEKFGCTEAQVTTSLATFRASLHQWIRSIADSTEDVVLDSASRHCWRVPKGELGGVLDYGTRNCCCGLKSVPVEHLQDFDLISGQEYSSLVFPPPDTKSLFTSDNLINSETVLDSFSAAKEALSRAVFTANLLLSVGQFVTERG